MFVKGKPPVHRSWSRTGIVAFCLFLGLLLCTVSAQADDKLWGGLLVGSNEPPPDPQPARLQRYQPRLSRIFGYPYFSLIGQSKRELSADAEQWLIPGEDFSVRCFVRPGKADGIYRVSLQLFRGQKELVQTVARLSRGSPLFIRGPLYGKGQLIIVIMVRDKD